MQRARALLYPRSVCMTHRQVATIKGPKKVLPHTRHFTKRSPFVDRVKCLVASGSGGDGASIMLHFANEEFGGPGGGNGGRGGDVILVSSPFFEDLEHIEQMGSHISAANGMAGGDDRCTGRGGKDMRIVLPVGTQVRDVDSNEVAFDLDTPGQEVLMLTGGKGGRGNEHFASDTCHSPHQATRGTPGNTMLVQFELKLLADVGLVGFPNAGKSSLLGAMTTSQPQVAAYPFTTIRPHIGRLHAGFSDDHCAVADLPGLIEGAYENRGLGHQFLRHVERSMLLVYVVDMVDTYRPDGQHATGPSQPWEVVEALQSELEFYQPGLSERAVAVFANKMDQPVDVAGRSTLEKLNELRKRLEPTGLRVFPMSAADGLVFGAGSPRANLAEPMEWLVRTVAARKRAQRSRALATRREEDRELRSIFEQSHTFVFHKSASEDAHRTDARNAAEHERRRANKRESDAFNEEDGTRGATRPVASSLVDQQLDDAWGDSGLTSFDEVVGKPVGGPRSGALGRFAEYQDLTMKGQYWRLTREDGEKLPDERW